MSNELRIFRFAPDQPGKGGHSTGFHAFMERQDTRRVEGFRPYRNMWWRDQTATVLITNNLSEPPSRTIRGYKEWLYYEAGGTSQKSQYLYASSHYDTVTAKYWVGWRTSANKDVVIDSNAARVPGQCMALDIHDRIILGTKLGYAWVWKGTTDGNGNPTHVYKLGTYSPSIGPTVTVAYNYTAGQYYYCGANGYSIQYNDTATDSTWDGLVPGEVIKLTHESLTNPAYMTTKVVERVSGTTVSTAPHRGPFAFTAKKETGITFSGTSSSTSGTINWDMPDNGNLECPDLIGLKITCGGQTRTILAATVNSGAGTTITVNSAWPSGGVSGSFSLTGVRVYVEDLITFESATLSDANRKASRPAPGTGYTSWSGAEAPGYAYAYYDPSTGHISNLSPITYVSETEVVNGQISIDLAQNDTVKCANGDTPVSGGQTSTGIQYIGEYNSKDVARFTHILFFRTRRSGGGAVLYPVGSLDPNSSAWRGEQGSPAYAGGSWVDSSTDADLVISGRIRAPLDTNHRPSYISPAGVRTEIEPQGMAWWDGRLWLYGLPEPTAIRFSCDAAQNAMGRAEECFPDQNRLVIPSMDGEITALVTCGEHLLVVTRRYTYRILGNHESNYRLVRVSTELGGLGPEAMCEIPSDNEYGGVLAAVTPDKRVLLVQIDGPTQEIGAPISTELGGGVYGVAFYRSQGHAKLAIAASASGSTAGQIFEYNFTHKTWTKNNPVITGNLSPSTGVNYLTSLVRGGSIMGAFLAQTESTLIFGLGKNVYYYAQSTTTAAYEPYITTWMIPGTQVKRRYAFAWARVVMTSPTVNVSAVTAPYFRVNRDGRTLDVLYTMEEHSVAGRGERAIFAGAGQMNEYVVEYVCMAPNWTRWGDQAITNTGAIPVGYQLEFMFYPNGNDANIYAVAFIEIAVREWTEDGDVEP